jgi:uncharacterized protein YjaZ
MNNTLSHIVEDEKDSMVQIPFHKNHYQFTFKTCKGGKTIRRIYKDNDMYDIAKKQALKDYPESIYHIMHSPQCD